MSARLFRVGELAPRERASLEQGLRADLDGIDRVAIDSLGRGTVVMREGADAAPEALSASLSKRGSTAADFELRRWPRLDATYEVSVAGMSCSSETRKVADALAGVAKVIAVHVDREAGTATLWLKEPCDALEGNVRAALASAGFAPSRFELRADGAPGSG
ncbi:MAG: copper chaperone [Planctomycetota bacterium]|nr:MAG: copper chaperone [Planctomycetota bacterium]